MQRAIQTESYRAKAAFADYLAMGPERSLPQLERIYRSRPGFAPTRQVSYLKRWSTTFGWQARLQAIADEEARKAMEREQAYRREIMEEGYGLKHERVKSLKQLAGDLLGAIDLNDFDRGKLEQFRGLLEDIAKEKGERKDVREITTPDGEPLFKVYVGIDLDRV